MPNVSFPYGRESLEYNFPQDRLLGELVSQLHHYKASKSPLELVQEALENPIGTPRLSVMAEGKKNIVLIASDHTRPVPSKVIVPPMLAELRRGNPQAEITILIATGCHRGTTPEELEAKFGREIMQNERIVIHDCDTSPLRYVGKLPSGGDLILNEIALDADLLISEGFIEPHFFAGFSGGRKSVLPGVASRKTVLYNHNSEFIAHPCARTGVLQDNPIHNDMLYAARTAGLAFVCNVVLDADKNTIFAVAGDCDLAHRVGCSFLAEKCQVQAIPADIAVSTNGGYPLDQNVYQAVKGMTAAEATVKKGGVIIMLAQSDDGHGAPEFHKTFVDEKDLNRMTETFLATPKNSTRMDQWEAQILARVLTHATVIYISDAPDEMIRDFQMIPAHSLPEAVEIAEKLIDKPNPGFVAIPDGIAVMVKK